MSMEEKKAGAIRIFEALSGVDEELLVKCADEPLENAVIETTDINSTRHKRTLNFGNIKNLYANKYRLAGTVAAAICVFAVGVSLWAGVPRFAGKMESAKDCAVAESIMEVPAEYEMAAATAMEGSVAEEGIAGESANERSTNEESTITGSTATGSISGASGAMQEDMKDSVSVNTQNAEEAENYKQSSSADVEMTSADIRMEITLAEARATAVLGEYVPAEVPEGYTWEAGYLAQNAETGEDEGISLYWTKGMDSIEIFISKPAEITVTIADTEKPETYNVHLYDIPYASTVPEEYREVFNSPVFNATDFDRDIVEARMKVFADAGDTTTPRGKFTVLYGDGVLVRFSGRGSVEEIWEMFQSIK